MTNLQSATNLPKEAAYRRFLRNYYLTSAGFDFVFAYAVYTVFLKLQGLTVFQISLLISWWTLSHLLLEIPTGAWADSWSRKKMLALAPLIKSLCFVTWFFAGGNFYLLALGFLFWSLGGALASGTSEALLYDTLVRYERREQYEQVLGRRQFDFYLALAVSGILGGVIAYSRIAWTLPASVLPLLLSASFALLLEEPPKVKASDEVGYWQHIRLTWREMRSNQTLRYLLIFLVGISVLWDLEEFDQLYYQLAGLPLVAFGLVLCLGAVLNALGARFAHRLKNCVWVIYVLPLSSAVALLLAGVFPSLPGIGLLLLAYFIIVPVEVLLESRLQHSIIGVSRATVTSAASLLVGVFGVGVPVAFGLISKMWHLPAIYLTSALQLFILSVWAFGARHRLAGEQTGEESP